VLKRREIEPLIRAIVNAEILQKEAKAIYNSTTKAGASEYDAKIELDIKTTGVAHARKKLIEFLRKRRDDGCYSRCPYPNLHDLW
jgi:hypothetical protein